MVTKSQTKSPIDRDALTATAMCTSFNLRKATRMVSQFYAEAMKASGLKGTQFSLLSVATSTGPISMTRLAGEMAMDRTTLTRNLKPLEAKGLIFVRPGADRRERVVTVTGEGEEILALALPMWRKAQNAMIDRLGDDLWGDLLRQLRTAREAAQQ